MIGVDRDRVSEVGCREEKSTLLTRHIKMPAPRITADSTAAKLVLKQDKLRNSRMGHVAPRSNQINHIENPARGFSRAHIGRLVAIVITLCEIMAIKHKQGHLLRKLRRSYICKYCRDFIAESNKNGVQIVGRWVATFCNLLKVVKKIDHNNEAP
jgi:hypothetical protein